MPGANADRGLLAGEYVVLALLKRGPMHGYEMARMAREEGIGDVCALEQSALYAYLNNLEARGLVGWREQRQGRRPPRKLYALTASGSEEADRWLRQPVSRMREVRREFLVKVHLLESVHSADIVPLLRRQLAVCRLYLERIDEELRGAAGFARLVALSRQSAAQATIAWIEAYANELVQGGASDEPGLAGDARPAGVAGYGGLR
jgi:PadR family transcriptional regulator AphA